MTGMALTRHETKIVATFGPASESSCSELKQAMRKSMRLEISRQRPVSRALSDCLDVNRGTKF